MRPALAFTIATWVSIVLGVALGIAAAVLWHQLFVTIIAISLVMQNWAQWKQFQRLRADHAAAGSDQG